MPSEATFSFEFLGTDGKSVTRRFHSQEVTDVSEAAELAILKQQLEDMRTAINELTDANIGDYGMQVQGDQAVGTLPADANVKEIVSLTLDITEPNEPQKYATVSLPAPSDDIFAGATGPNLNIVDISNADVLAFVQELIDNCLVSDGEEVVALVSGVRGGRSYRG